jgi:hypothetical protein
MRRLIAMMIVVFVPATVITMAAFALYKPGLPIGAQAALENYIHLRYPPSSQPITIQQASQASKPQNFSDQMSSASYDVSGYFQPTYQPPFKAQVGTPSPAPTGVATVSFAPASGSGISYPPQELWCVLLTQTDAPKQQVIFAGLYEDIYTARWIIHETRTAASGQELQAVMARVGCKLNLGEP